jgi:hypothetical protein
MTVKELRDILKDFDDGVDVMTKKTEILGNIGEINSVRKDSYGFFGVDVPCVLLSDEFESQEREG